MKYSQITPWSIYCQTQDHFNKVQPQPVSKVKKCFFPKIQAKEKVNIKKKSSSIIIGKPFTYAIINSNHSAHLRQQSFHLGDKQYDNDEQLTQKQAKQRQQLLDQNKNLNKKLQQKFLISIIKNNLRSACNPIPQSIIRLQESFSHLSIEQIHKKEQVLKRKKARSHNKLNTDKSLMIVNANKYAEKSFLLDNSAQMDPQMIKKLVKKQINSLMSHRMKVLGFNKQIIHKI